MDKKKKVSREKKIASLIYRYSLNENRNPDKQKLDDILKAIKDTNFYSSGMVRELKKLYQNYYDSTALVIVNGTELTEEEQEMIGKLFNRNAEYKSDHSLIAGSIIRDGWDLYDLSVKTKLDRILKY